ncbi:MAG: GNAT family N-acetyltransferase [Lachnospiraceae bacterium]|jgi:predicted acetyltransferase|nr:GNAT family N-acetyltransferase [Lachnospiraceae bacterium]MCI9479697.1 GNAT family N-acetyltransferase [Lachnospiraceae bacterium]MCI9624401.1 GNAT family N-acetyltransferase [Lachnospiraceae bacterium]
MVYEEIRLVKPALELKDKALEYRQEHFDYGEQIINGSELFDKIPSYEEWLEKVIANASTQTVDPDWVLTDTFFAVRVTDNKIVGIADLRYQLNDFLKDFGNCGYSVRPSERRKGYAAEILRQICLTARKHGMKQLQLSASKDNAASIKTIEKNGGNYCRSFTFDNEEASVYLINL